MLHSIREIREEHTTSSPQLMSCVYHTLAMLHCTLRELAKVLWLCWVVPYSLTSIIGVCED